MTDEDDRKRDMMGGMIPTEWDMKPVGLAHEISRLLDGVKDEGTAVDTGTGDGSANLWITVDGIEFYLTIRRSNNQLKRDAP